ncbi:S8 family serine peptidase [Pseudonocardia sp. DSM 110487]|uniref:S8 family peptidase n=1 Tax=Pseudonocardia sp. DSM 110487 TaxID=2865833 RepID=UPI001C69CEC9|nr:S8 family serine peptidase [Pseudonocardia sp. DSM 110487]QYN39139.1 S8 family serine peptidase [Pseudonocardia sp. DSM 110487]
MADPHSTARDAIVTATHVRPDGAPAPARFALELRPGQDPAKQAERVRAALAGLDELDVTVEPLSELDPDVLVATFPGRVLADDPTAAFVAAHELRAEFDLAAAEPDLPTAFFPEKEEAGGAGRESVGGFPPGCFAPEEPAIEADPRWALRAMRVPDAWGFSQAQQRPGRGAGVVVAQPDTGVTVHPELAGVAVAPGRDIIDSDDDPTDPLTGGNEGHGTGTASVLVSPESLVMAGTAPLARHMPIRAVESVIRITQVSVAQAIDWAVASGAHVITMSLGGIPSFSLHRALRRAVEADVIVLAAAGNCVRTVVWPARYDDCIAVAGTNIRGEQWRGSCRGAAVDVSAPAENVVRARIGLPAVGQGQGTSFAVAMVAGVAALWLAHHGRAALVAAARARGETLQTMFRRLLQATAQRPPGWDSSAMGAGIVDARALLGAALDLGSGRESVEPPGAGAVETLVAEAFGADAVDETVDWHQFGPELATTVLQARLAGPAERAPRTVVTAHLAAAVGNPALRARLGLPSLRDPATVRQGETR